MNGSVVATPSADLLGFRKSKVVDPVGFVPLHVHEVTVIGGLGDGRTIVAPPLRNTGSPNATFSLATESANGPTLKLTKSSSDSAPSVTWIRSWSRPWVVRDIRSTLARSGKFWNSVSVGAV